MPTLNLGREPVAIITVLVLALGALNTQISGLSTTVHSLLSAVLIVLGAVLARAAVTPVAAPQPTPLVAQLGHFDIGGYVGGSTVTAPLPLPSAPSAPAPEAPDAKVSP